MGEERPPRKESFRNLAVKKGARKLRAMRKNVVNAWWGFGLFGLVGWSVIFPTLLGVFVGMWLDRHFSGSHSWTLILMLTGIFAGSTSAFFLLAKEMFKEEDD